jgi:hypothetical protein
MLAEFALPTSISSTLIEPDRALFGMGSRVPGSFHNGIHAQRTAGCFGWWLLGTLSNFPDPGVEHKAAGDHFAPRRPQPR